MTKNIAALLLGAALTLAFAPFYLFPLAFIAPAGLLYLLIDAKTTNKAFWLGFFFGIGLFSTGVYWVFISIHEFGDVPPAVALFITAGLIAILALFPAFTCYFTQRYFPLNTKTKIWCAFPAIWIFIEWARSWIGGGFPWLFLGYSQTNSPLRGYAPILSVYGVSLALLLTSSALVSCVLFFRSKQYKSLYFSVLFIVALWVGGSLLNLVHWSHPIGKPITVSLVQGNIPQSLKWSPEHIQLSFDRYENLTKPLWGKSDVIIWPEAAIPVPLQNSESFIDKMDEQAIKSGSHLILGIPMQNAENNQYYNGIITAGKNHNVYMKRRLVPYGEYIPFKSISGRIFDFMNVPMSDLIPGDPIQPPIFINDLVIDPAICFEIAFPGLVNTQNNAVNLLLTITNDAWFGKSIAQAQHLQMGVMRSIELARPLLFGSNNGITAIVNAEGQITAIAPEYVTTVLTSTVQPTTGMTPWMLLNMDPILFTLLCLLIAAIYNQRKQVKLNTVNKS
jgi:apolipoprotein N-acyltransferase